MAPLFCVSRKEKASKLTFRGFQYLEVESGFEPL